MGTLASKSESRVNPVDSGKPDSCAQVDGPGKDPKNGGSPAKMGALGAQGRGMSMSRLAVGKDASDSDSDDGKLTKQDSRNENRNTPNPETLVQKPHHDSSEKKNKDIGYWYFDIGASMKNRSWRIMEIGNTGGKGLSGGTHPVHSKKKK